MQYSYFVAMIAADVDVLDQRTQLLVRETGLQRVLPMQVESRRVELVAFQAAADIGRTGLGAGGRVAEAQYGPVPRRDIPPEAVGGIHLRRQVHDPLPGHDTACRNFLIRRAKRGLVQPVGIEHRLAGPLGDPVSGVQRSKHQ